MPKLRRSWALCETGHPTIGSPLGGGGFLLASAPFIIRVLLQLAFHSCSSIYGGAVDGFVLPGKGAPRFGSSQEKEHPRKGTTVCDRGSGFGLLRGYYDGLPAPMPYPFDAEPGLWAAR